MKVTVTPTSKLAINSFVSMGMPSVDGIPRSSPDSSIPQKPSSALRLRRRSAPTKPSAGSRARASRKCGHAQPKAGNGGGQSKMIFTRWSVGVGYIEPAPCAFRPRQAPLVAARPRLLDHGSRGLLSAGVVGSHPSGYPAGLERRCSGKTGQLGNSQPPSPLAGLTIFEASVFSWPRLLFVDSQVAHALPSRVTAPSADRDRSRRAVRCRYESAFRAVSGHGA